MTRPLSYESWAEFLSEKEVPVLRQTARAITEARERADNLHVRKLAALILHDPLMSLRLLRYTARHHARRKLQDVATVEHAVMMLGVEPFFRQFQHFDVVEDQLKAHPQALLGLLQVIRRAQRASRFAWDWATWRCDLNGEEIAVAALLHDLAEMLVWCFAPEKALAIQTLKKANPAMRSADAQKAVLGFPFNALQTALCQRWQMPELLLDLMDDSHAERPRVKNVKLAVDLARHSSEGWNDPALPDDLKAIASLMRVDEETVKLRIGLKSPDEST